MAETESAKSTKPESSPSSSPNSLEVLFGSALAGIASLLKDPSQRTLATALAPPLGYIIVKLGRKLVDVWIPLWTTPKIPPPETPESRILSFIKEAREQIASGKLPPEESQSKAEDIYALEKALRKKLLDDLQAVPVSDANATKQAGETPQKLLGNT